MCCYRHGYWALAFIFTSIKTILCLRPLHDVKSDSHSVSERSISLPLTKSNTHTHIHSNNVKHNDIYITWLLQIIQNTTRAEIIKTRVKKKNSHIPLLILHVNIYKCFIIFLLKFMFFLICYFTFTSVRHDTFISFFKINV